jgi:CheY-like chemotaxis protein
MIYLIDDKKERQSSYNWDDEKIKLYKNILTPIWTYDDMQDVEIRQGIFSNSNIICFHESFFNNPLNKEKIDNEFSDVRKRIDEFAALNPNFLLIYFSGSISSRLQVGNICYMPVSIFYKNLEVFLSCFDEKNNVDYLFYGNNPNLEKEFKAQYVRAVDEFDENIIKELKSTNLVIQQDTIKYKVKNPLSNAEEIFINGSTDAELIDEISKWHKTKKFDNIFIPLCFGHNFSDFNGLRLASLIRCIPGINQTSSIYIYSFLDLTNILYHTFFNILKTKNVELISFSKRSFIDNAEKEQDCFYDNEIPSELEKLKLDIPGDYYDSHHIANEWGIYQMTRNANFEIDIIAGFEKGKLDTIYFRWLIAKNGLYDQLPESQKRQQKIYLEKIRGIKIVDKISLNKESILLIDDQAYSGWKSILEKAVVKGEGIIKVATTEKNANDLIRDKVNLIFLDVRLTEEDHIEKDISQLTGFRILKKIKRDFMTANFSTPIILLTATNNAWIMEEFKQNGIDSYYIKEHPDNGFNKGNSRNNLERLQKKFLELMHVGSKRNLIWRESVSIIEKLNNHCYFNGRDGYTNIKERIIDKLKLGFAYLFNEQMNYEQQVLKSDNESLSFIIYWSILEEIIKGYSDSENWSGRKFNGSWKFRNNAYFIRNDGQYIKVEPFWKENKNIISKEFETTQKEADKYLKGKVNLSEQIHALSYHYSMNLDKENNFNELNSYRNQVDYIHSSVETIFGKPLYDKTNQEKAFNKIVDVLKIINKILLYPK